MEDPNINLQEALIKSVVEIGKVRAELQAMRDILYRNDLLKEDEYMEYLKKYRNEDLLETSASIFGVTAEELKHLGKKYGHL